MVVSARYLLNGPTSMRVCVPGSLLAWTADMACWVTPGPELQVYKGVWQGNTPVAVKFVTGHSPKEQQRFRNEVAILKSLRHVNIVQFLGASLTGDQIMLVTEYMPRGDLWRALSQDSTHHFSWNSV